MLSNINKEIKQAGLISTDKFLYKFLDNEEKIISELNKFQGLKSEIYLNQNIVTTSKEHQNIKFASIFSDLVSIYAGGNTRSSNHITFFDPGSPYYCEREITVPNSLISEIKQEYNIIPCYMHDNSDDIRSYMKSFGPFIDNATAIVRPIRSLWVNKSKVAINNNAGVLYYAEGDTDIKHWVVKENFSRNSLPVNSNFDVKNTNIALKLVLPYINDVSYRKFIKDSC